MAALAGTRASAADLPIRRPVPEPIVVPPVATWTGAYVGGGVDARFNAVDANVTEAFVGTPPVAIPLPTVSPGYSNPLFWWGAGPGAMQYIDNISIGLRLYGGYNLAGGAALGHRRRGGLRLRQRDRRVPRQPLSGQPDLRPAGPDRASRSARRTTTSSRSRRDGTPASALRGGWLSTPTTLIYLTAGLAWAHLEVTSTCSTTPTPNVNNCAPGNYFGGTLGPSVVSHSGIKLGWTAGAGVETMITSNWMVRGQYRFADFGYPSFGPFKPFSFSETRTCTGCPAGANPLTVSYELPLMQHHFEVGVAYKF